ncbi:MAG: hypothetical protein K5790_10210 [Nitrosopumilus sp.]|uniref:hypothetical protein n=1 Tax=Nitrosopumilus sp. TaxID=2024843 RepID=UPI00247DC150|nr:hypothetical protein [Nitrosopumilus sp.]MCV0393642.1 hypothetical protein [Nitrosopumilus sp.]
MEKLIDNNVVDGELDVFRDKDARWQLVLGWKNKKYRALDAFRKLDKVMKKNAEDTENPIQYENRNLKIKEEMDRLSDVIDFCKTKMNEIIAEIHKDKHR